MKRSRTSIVATAVAALCLLIAPAVAGAASPNATQYENPSTSEPTQVAGAAGGNKGAPLAPPVASSPGGTLPFTGQNLLVVAGIGGALIAAGLGLRAAARARRDQ